eukprot:gene46503-62201_t
MDKKIGIWLKKNKVETIHGKLRFDGVGNYGDDLMKIKQRVMPSFNLLAQSILSGMFIGGLYGLIGLGLGLTWGLLRQINLAHFGLVFLAAYGSYHMATVWKVDPLL